MQSTFATLEMEPRKCFSFPVLLLLLLVCCLRKYAREKNANTNENWRKKETEADGVDLYYVQRKEGTKCEEEREREARNVLETMYAFFGMRLATGGGS